MAPSSGTVRCFEMGRRGGFAKYPRGSSEVLSVVNVTSRLDGCFRDGVVNFRGSRAMTHQTRMSPLTALFLGIFGVAGVGIVSAAVIVLYGMTVVNSKASEVLGFTDTTVVKVFEALPELMESLPAAVGDVLNDKRDPDYAKNLDIKVAFVVDDNLGVRPVLTILNEGDRTVSMLAVRVAALNEQGLPVREWTEVVATPVAVYDEWRGVIMPGGRRHVVLHSSWCGSPEDMAETITAVAEISELRVWEPPDDA